MNSTKTELLKSFLLSILVLLLPAIVSAKHIVGGDVTYRCLGIEDNSVRFEITFTMYRDSEGGGAGFDPGAQFGVFVGDGNIWSHFRTITANPMNINAIDLNTGNPCLEVPPGVGVESGIYRFNVVLPISDTDSYMIAYQRCCRNNTINNIIDPDVTGAVFSVTITPLAQRTCDNSPLFNDFPPVVICNNSLLNFDHSATDPDGNQVIYSFCNPMAAGGTDGVNGGDADACTGITPNPVACGPPFDLVQFVQPAYSVTRPLGGNPAISINGSSGLISGVPNIVGQFVVGVCAQSFNANGEFIGEVRRDFQFNVTTCEVAVQASVDADEIIDESTFVIRSCGERNVDFINLSTDESKILSYDWEFMVDGNMITSDTRNTTIAFPDTGRYYGNLFLNKQGNFSQCQDTAELIVDIFPEINADFTFDYDTCVAGPVDLIDESVSGAGPVQAWEWMYEGDVIANDQTTSYTFTDPGEKPVFLRVVDENNCEDVIEKDIVWYPVPPLVVVQPDQFVGCVPGSISFNNLSEPINEEYNVIWDFGDGKTTDELSPVHLYEDTGIFDVSVRIVSPIGCETSAEFSNWITMLESPIAGFSYTPENPSNFNKEVQFIDESEGAVAWLWNIGGIGFLDQNPSYTFADTGMVRVEQVVTHPTGCTDTMVQFVDIMPLVTLHMPNAFTPNNDGLNDVFKGKGFFEGFRGYSLTVWNRWGEKIFDTTDPNDGWNGKLDNEGSDSPPGVYIYSINYIGPRGENNELKGHVTLIR